MRLTPATISNCSHLNRAAGARLYGKSLESRARQIRLVCYNFCYLPSIIEAAKDYNKPRLS